MKLTLPLPPKELSPNHTVGSLGMRMAKAEVIKLYRSVVCEEAQIWRAENEHTFPWREATIQLTFFKPTKRRSDPDNMLASCKCYFDGLRDAGILLDDDRITHLPVLQDKDKDNPRLEMLITN